jgi:hypothetical protein
MDRPGGMSLDELSAMKIDAERNAEVWRQRAGSLHERVRLLEQALRYWMPDECLLSVEDEIGRRHADTWHQHIALLNSK